MYDVRVHPQPPPPVKADSDHGIVYATVRLSGRFAPNRHVRTIKQIRPFDRQNFRSDEDCRQRVVEQILSKLLSLPGQPSSTSEMAESLVKVVLDAVAKEAPLPRRRAHQLGWRDSAETSAGFKVAWDTKEDGQRLMPIKRDQTAWKTHRTACANPRGVIDAGVHAK